MTSQQASVGSLSAVFMTAAIILLGIAGWMISRDPLFSGAEMKAVGTVIDLERSATGNGRVAYYPVVAFRDDTGTERRFVGSIGSNPPDYRRGEQVGVRYDPAAPEEAMIDSWTARLLGPGLTGGMGLLLLWFEVRAIRSARRARRRSHDAEPVSTR